MDIVDLAETLATKPDLTKPYQAACNAGDGQRANALVSSTMERLDEEASKAWTKTGRSVKLDQAKRVFRLLGSKAEAAGTQSGAPEQALWCSAVADRLERAR